MELPISSASPRSGSKTHLSATKQVPLQYQTRCVQLDTPYKTFGCMMGPTTPSEPQAKWLHRVTNYSLLNESLSKSVSSGNELGQRKDGCSMEVLSRKDQEHLEKTPPRTPKTVTWKESNKHDGPRSPDLRKIKNSQQDNYPRSILKTTQGVSAQQVLDLEMEAWREATARLTRNDLRLCRSQWRNTTGPAIEFKELVGRIRELGLGQVVCGRAMQAYTRTVQRSVVELPTDCREDDSI